MRHVTDAPVLPSCSMVPAPVPDLSDELVVRGVAADEVVSAPLESLGVSLSQPGSLVAVLIC